LLFSARFLRRRLLSPHYRLRLAGRAADRARNAVPQERLRVKTCYILFLPLCEYWYMRPLGYVRCVRSEGQFPHKLQLVQDSDRERTLHRDVLGALKRAVYGDPSPGGEGDGELPKSSRSCCAFLFFFRSFLLPGVLGRPCGVLGRELTGDTPSSSVCTSMAIRAIFGVETRGEVCVPRSSPQLFVCTPTCCTVRQNRDGRGRSTGISFHGKNETPGSKGPTGGTV